MTSYTSIPLLLVSACLALSLPAHAELIARDLNNDMVTDSYYDTNLNITWLKDSNTIAANSFGLQYGVNMGPHPADIYQYAESYIHDNGLANWGGAMHWIDAMNRNSYLGHNSWRLPTTPQLGDSYCWGYDCRNSDLGYMFYENLGGQSGVSIIDSHGDNYDNFINIHRVYWSDQGWNFHMDDGFQRKDDPNVTFYYVWAVIDGDVAAVPEPEIWAMLLAGLGLIGVATRRRRG